MVALVLLAAPAWSAAQGKDAGALRSTVSEFTRLRSELNRINAEVADLKHSDRSVRNDYRLRDRMADAEALAKKVTETESRLRALGWSEKTSAGNRSPSEPPQALPQDGSVELEAKAGLFADQAGKLDGEATLLARAANELRSRKALHKRAGAWDRDPFSGLETSKRSIAVSGTVTKSPLSVPSGADSPPRGGASAPSAQTNTGSAPTLALPPSVSSGTSSPVSAAPAPGATVTTDTSNKEALSPVGPESATSTKTSPLPQSPGQGPGLDRQAFEQRLYLDPATAAELRHVLGAAGAASDPDALDRAAATLRARARTLNAQAQALLVKSRVP